jgi:hypothetical protein
MSTRTRSPPRLVGPSISCILKKCSRYRAEVMHGGRVCMQPPRLRQHSSPHTHDFPLDCVLRVSDMVDRSPVNMPPPCMRVSVCV